MDIYLLSHFICFWQIGSSIVVLSVWFSVHEELLKATDSINKAQKEDRESKGPTDLPPAGFRSGPDFRNTRREKRRELIHRKKALFNEL